MQATSIPSTSPAPATPPPDDLFIENLAALWAADPALARATDPAPGNGADAREPARKGGWTVQRPAEGGQSIYLHSKYDPQQEATRWSAALRANDPAVAFVFGLGLGYGVADALAADDRLIVWAFEPDAVVLAAALRTADLAQPLRDRRLRIVTELDKGKLFADWNPHLAAIHIATATAALPAALRTHPEYFAAAKALVDEFAAYCKTSINTLLVNSRRTCENLARNAPHYVRASGLTPMRDSARGKPAIIVAAGPSLRKNKHLLPEAAKGGVIIAVQTALRQVLDLGLEPDFVTSLDYHDISTQFFQNVDRDIRTRLVAEPKASPKVLAAGPRKLSLLGNDFLDRLLREIKLDRPRLRAGATVAHLAFYLAEFLGCNPIIFVGQDLGFSDGLAYAPGTSYDALWQPELGRFNTSEMMHWQRIMRDKPILRRLPDYRGRQTFTEERLYSYLQQFERDFAQSDRTIIDATEGGVAKRGATPMTFAEAIAEHCQAPLDRSVFDRECRSHATIEQAIASIAERKHEAERIAEISRQTLEALRSLNDATTDAAKAGACIATIDRLRVEMNALGMTYELVTQMTPTSELNRYRADRKLGASGLTAEKKQLLQIERDIANVNHLESAAGVFIELMDDTLAELAAAASGLRRAA